MSRARTISKIWYDDEVLFKDPKNGDIHLKSGVKRQSYGTEIDPNELESHINYWDLSMRKLQGKISKLTEVDNNERE